MTTFTPCSPTCPAVTGKPNGSTRYCPMQALDRHRSAPTDYGARKRSDGRWEQWDWRTETWEPCCWVETTPGLVRRDPVIPPHPDYTDCCADFRCCADLWARAGLAHVGAALVDAAAQGDPVVMVGDPPPLPTTSKDMT